jgi:hypothetical protein
MTRARFITIETRQYTGIEGERANSQARQLREQDMNDYGRQGYTLFSTVVVPLHDGLTILDTLTRVEDE